MCAHTPWMKKLAQVEVTLTKSTSSRWNLIPHSSDSFVSIHTYLNVRTLNDTHICSHTHTHPLLCFCINTNSTVLSTHTVLTVSYSNRTGWIVQLKCDGHVCVSQYSKTHIRLIPGYRKRGYYIRISQCYNLLTRSLCVTDIRTKYVSIFLKFFGFNCWHNYFSRELKERAKKQWNYCSFKDTKLFLLHNCLMTFVRSASVVPC